MEHVSHETNELVERYLADERPRGGRSRWLTMNMITSIDGAIAVAGRSSALGGTADRAVFRALRGLADVILVAAGTVRAERYNPPAVDDVTARRREARGQAPRPLIAVVTRSLGLDLDTPLFAGPDYRPTVVSVADAPADRRARVEAVADVVEAGTSDVDLEAATAVLAQRHGPLILVEGGPTLNGHLVDADIVDEMCITVSPVVVGDPGGGLLGGRFVDPPRGFVLDRAIGAEGFLFCRYLRSER